MKWLEKLYNKIPIYIFGLLFYCILVIGIVISLIWHNSIEPVNPFNFWISNLGAGPFATPGNPTEYIGSTIVFNCSLLIAAIFGILFFIGLTRIPLKIQSKLGSVLKGIACVCGLVCMGGMIIVAPNDMMQRQELHVLGALMLFLPILIWQPIYTILLHYTQNKSKIPLIVMIINMLIFIMYVVIVYISGLDYGLSPLDLTWADIIDLMSSMDPALAWVRFWEWICLPALYSWIFITSFVIWYKSIKRH